VVSSVPTSVIVNLISLLVGIFSQHEWKVISDLDQLLIDQALCFVHARVLRLLLIHSSVNVTVSISGNASTRPIIRS
jgi:hypothetical protein